MTSPTPADAAPADAAACDVPARTEAEQQAFFNSVLACALKAEAAVGLRERLIEVAGVRVRLCFAGPRLEGEFMRALGHLEVARDDKAEAVFHVWDSASTGVTMIPPPCHQSAFTDRGDIWGFSSTAVRSAFHWSEFSVCLLHAQSGVGVYWVNDAANLPYWAKSSPMRTLFHWLMEQRGLQLLHAAAFGTADGGVLVTGKGGVGKSSTALAALAAGMAYIGDDYVIVGLEPAPTAYTLFSTAKLEPHQFERFPELQSLIEDGSSPGDEKVVIHLHPAHADRIVKSIPLKYVLTPRFGSDPQTHFEPILANALHRAAAFTTLSQLPHAGLATHNFIRQLIERTAIAHMVLGHDLRAIPSAIEALLQGPPIEQMDAPSPMSAQPLISVIIPVFNGAHFLKEAVASVLAQDYAALEIIVVDDGSSDAIEAAVKALGVDVRFLRQANLGPAAARNRGIRDASGALIAFLDVDDLWPAGQLKRMGEQLAANPKAQVVLGRGQLARIDPTEPDGYRFIGNVEEAYPNYIGAGLYRACAFKTNGLFDESLRFAEDTDWYARARECGLDIVRLDEISLIVRRHDANMTKGRSVVELNTLKAFKKALDRRREMAAKGAAIAPD